MTIKTFTFLIVFLAGLTSVSFSQPSVPDHEGRWVIDDASIIDAETEKTITTLVRDHYKSTSNQVVVYTFNSLEGSTIEDYSNEVYKTWKLGSKKNNNGVILVICYLERKIRIEVGYGLEASLTDLEASDIIKNEIKPQFKKGDFNTGILHGVQAVIIAIDGTYTPPGEPTFYFWIGLVFFIIVFIGGSGIVALIISFIIRAGRSGNSSYSSGNSWTNTIYSDSGWSSYDSGNSDWDSGSDFSGDGGSSGGGGASDDW